MVTHDMDDLGEGRGRFAALGAVMRFAAIVGLIIGPLILGGVLGLASTVLIEGARPDRVSNWVEPSTFSVSEVTAVGLSPRAVSGVLLPRE